MQESVSFVTRTFRLRLTLPGSLFSQPRYLYIFGGWNNEQQFNDLFMLDVENKDWSDLDMPWGVPRWNCNAQVVEAIPSWRVFIFGGVCDKHQEGRSMGIFDTSIGVLDLGEKS